MKPYSCNENYGHDVEDIEDVAVSCKKTTRQYAKKEIEKDLEYYNYYHMPWFEQPWDFKDFQEIKKDLND